jgi:hypothetical protein
VARRRDPSRQERTRPEEGDAHARDGRARQRARVGGDPHQHVGSHREPFDGRDRQPQILPYLDVPKKQVDAILKKPPKELKFKKNGEFKVVEKHEIEGIYSITSNDDGTQHIRITITKKPWFATVKMIKSQLEKFLEEG